MAPSSPDKKLLFSKLVSGIDLPTSDVVELLASHDTLAKKLTCRHIADRCNSNADLALLTANLLLRDASDANPSVRSASVSALATLPGIEESAVRAIMAALSDQAAMVRRAGVVGCAQLYCHARTQVVGGGLVDALYEALRDSDPIVVTNSLLALDRILEGEGEGGVVVNKNIAHHLLARLMQFSEHSAVYVLTLLQRYSPKSEDELFLLLNTLDELLLSKAPAVLVATVHLFLHWTSAHAHLKKDMLEMIQPSVCKILGQNVAETSYLVLEFLSGLGEVRQVFGPYFKYFLVRSKDPGYLKSQKLKMLPHVSTEDNVCSLVSEVQPFCSDYQSFHGAVACLGALARVSVPARNLCLTILVGLLDAPAERVVIAALECLLCVVPPVPVPQKLPSTSEVDTTLFTENESPLLPPQLPQELREVVTRAVWRDGVQEAAPTLVLQVLGSLASQLPAAPDIIQRMSALCCLTDHTHADLVTAAGRVFLARPAQMQLLLAAILAQAFKTPGTPATRAALVYSALQEKPSDVAHLLGASIIHSTVSTTTQQNELLAGQE